MSSNYEYLFLARSCPKGQIDLAELQAKREQLRRVSASMDQYVEMKGNGTEPVAITSLYDNKPVRMINPRRKLRRNYENYQLPESPSRLDESPCSESGASHERIFVSNAFLTLKSSQESLLDEKRDEHCPVEATDKRLKHVQNILPTSPTHYVQPPTPDHPPPSAMHAEKSIHERIRPLSQVRLFISQPLVVWTVFYFSFCL